MRIAICDDDKSCLTQMQAWIKTYAQHNADRNTGCFAFESAGELIGAVEKTGAFDIYFLDVVMPEKDGIQLGVQLRRAGDSGKIIYVTTSAEYAIDSFRAKAFNYILKPLKERVFMEALAEAVEAVAVREEKRLVVRTNEGSVMLSLDSILYAELNRRTIVYHLANGRTVESIQIRTTFSEAVQELVRDGRFTLCGASIVANLHHITMVEKDALLFRDSSKVYIPRRTCSLVRSAWYDYWFNGEDGGR